MQFLKILFWCLLAFVAALFTIGNWTTVPIRLWGGMIAETNLPLLLLVTFLIGFLPMLVYHQATKWRLRQRITTAERTIAEIRSVATPPATATVATSAPLPSPVAPGKLV